MNARKIAVWMALLALTLIPAATAFAKEVGKLTITGPGIKTPIEITDRAKLLDQNESMYNYEAGSPNRPAWITDKSPYFEIARDFMDGDKVLATDRLHYYPAADGKIGAIQYVGMDDPGFSDQNNQWFPMNPSGDEWLKGVLAKNGVDVAALVADPQFYVDAAPAAAQSAIAAPTPAPQIPWTLIGGGAALIAALGLAAWVIRARQALQRA